jgi:glycosidase
MPSSLFSDEVNEVLSSKKTESVEVTLADLHETVTVTRPYPSPIDWRDLPIYFAVIDRFNNPISPPKSQWDKASGDRQGGTFEGVREQLAYIKSLGAGAIWLTPVLKNVQFPKEYNYHGYGITDFLTIDPKFGTSPQSAEAEFDALVNEAHARDLYIILDVVINHTGDVFAYDVNGELKDSVEWTDNPYSRIVWRDEAGAPVSESPKGIWPEQLQSNEWFRRQGRQKEKVETTQGDFDSLKEFKTELNDQYNDRPVQNLLIRAYQYAVARFDVDAFRIDTIKHVEREVALTFCNAVREAAFLVGKKNFFIFGEARTSDEKKLAEYTGRYTSEKDQIIGADAVLDFPLRDYLVQTVKGFAAPTVVKSVFDLRKDVLKDILSTHGEASHFFVTFLDNHDDPNRFLYPRDGGDYTKQLTLALGCLFCLCFDYTWLISENHHLCFQTKTTPTILTLS